MQWVWGSPDPQPWLSPPHWGQDSGHGQDTDRAQGSGDGAHGLGVLAEYVPGTWWAGDPTVLIVHGLGSLVLTRVTGCPGEVWVCGRVVGAP